MYPSIIIEDIIADPKENLQHEITDSESFFYERVKYFLDLYRHLIKYELRIYINSCVLVPYERGGRRETDRERK